jgi:hypothetical protein
MRATRTFIVIFIIILSARVGFSQPWYFNEIYNPNNTWAYGLSIIATDSGYFGCGVSPLTDPGYLYANTFVLNFKGEMTQWHSFGREGANFYVGDEGSLTTCNGGFGLFGSVHDYQNDSPHGIFYKFDQLGDTIFTRLFYNDSVYNTLVGRSCTWTIGGGFALAGSVSIDYQGNDIILIKIDSIGNEQWRTYLGTDLSDWPKSIIQTPDGGYAIGSWTRIPWELETADPVVFKTDSLGTLEWTLNLGGPFLDDQAMLCNTSDSCILVLTTYADSMFTPEFADNRTAFYKIDLEGDTLWTKKYKTGQNVNYISNIICTQNGDFLACGTSQISVALPHAGWLFRLNQSGDSLWYRDYYYYPEDPLYGSNYLSDVSLTSDNGFVAIGDASTIYPPDNENEIWVLKVDSVGCEIPNCWVGIEEEGGVEAWGQGEEGKRGELEIWPNPASGVLIVKCLGLSTGKDSSLVVNDMFGREMKEISVPENESEIQIKVGDFPPGLYLVVLKDGSKVIASSKLVIASRN